MATTVLGLKTFTASDPVDYNEVNDNYNKIDNGVKTALQGRAVQNLLVNSDFRIAQAGYGGNHGSKKYACDMWYDTYGFGSFSFNELQGLTVAYGTNHAYLVQKIEDASRYHGKTMTLAFGLSDGTIRTANGVWLDNAPSFAINFDNGTATLYSNSVELVVTSGSMTVKWAALYEGSYDASTLPAYQPKGYAAELAECSRYFERLTINLYAKNTDKLYIMDRTRVKKRIYPTTMAVKVNSSEATPTVSFWDADGDYIRGVIEFSTTGTNYWYGYLDISADL